MRTMTALRGGWGVALIAAPDATMGRLGGRRLDDRARAVTRVLGARHLLQAGVEAGGDGRRLLLLGVAADVLHASSMVALAAVDPTRARTCLGDAAVAGSWALAGAHALRTGR